MKVITRSLICIYKISPSLFIINTIFTLFAGASAGMSVFATKTLINTLQTGINGDNTFINTLLLYAAINIGITLLGIGQGYISQRQQMVIANELDIKVLEKCKVLNLQCYENEEIYNLITRANEMGKEKIYTTYINLLTLFETIVAITSVLNVLSGISIKLLALILIIPILSTIVNVRIGKRVYDVQKRRAQDNRKQSYINYLITSNFAIKEIISYNIVDFFVEKYSKIRDRILYEDKKILSLQSFWNLILGILEEILNLTVIIVVIFLAGNGQMLIGDTVAYIDSLATIENKIKNFLLGIATIYEDKLFAEQFFEFMDFSVPQNTGEKEINHIKNIEIRNLSYSYINQSKYALTNISLKLKKGTPIALVGENGSGKSSLIKILAGLYDDYTGDVLINGIPLNQLNSDSYKRHIGIIFQDYNQYELSLRENLSIAALNKLNDDKELKNVLKKVGLSFLLDENQKGLEAQMGNWFSGQELSQGQWQRLAIARVMLRDSDILIMDEPTAALDPIIEKEIFDLINNIAKEKILILITHRVENLLKYNPYIIVLKNGKIVTCGNKEEIQDNKEFKKLLGESK